MRARVLIPLIIATALFMENTDSTVISTSLPMIAQDLGEDPIALKLALTSYLVSLAIFIPVSGWMADRFGARTVFRAAHRRVHGGLARLRGLEFARRLRRRALLPGHGRRHDGAGRPARAVAQRSRSEVVQALATLTIPALVGPVVGPPLGGFITTYFHWRWIFFINIPIGILGIVLATLFIPNIKEENARPSTVVGFLLLGLGLALLMLGFATGGRASHPDRGLDRRASSSAALPRRSMSSTRGGRPHPVLQLEPP